MHKYLMFLYMNKILTDEEFDRAIDRLNTITNSNWCELAPIKDTALRQGMGDVLYNSNLRVMK